MMNKCKDCHKTLSDKSGKYVKRCRSCSKKGKLNPAKRLDVRKKMSKSHKRKFLSKNQIELIKKSMTGKNHWNYKDGRYLKKYYCKDCGNRISIHSGVYGLGYCRSCVRIGRKYLKHSQYMKGRFIGKNSPNWQGGTSFEEYGAEFDNALKEMVRFRDHYKCQICGCSQIENGRQLDVHHINYNKKNNNIKNLIGLCVRCHIKTNFNRDYWFAYFAYIMEEKYD